MGFYILSITRNDVEDDQIVANFLTLMGKISYSLLINVVFVDRPNSLFDETFK